ncbi:MAG: DUF1080 domain-containing protein [Planctomycetaceae bacterium]|nr:DUF1080 domain-containing protein [Planctomycetaceae bacterium]
MKLFEKDSDAEPSHFKVCLCENQMKMSLFTCLCRVFLMTFFVGTSSGVAEETFPGQKSEADLKQAGFVPLFDGSSLVNWDVQPWHEGHWTLANGILSYDGQAPHGKGKRADLWTKEEFGDFELYVEWRLPAKPEMKPHPIVLYNGDFLMQEENPRQRQTRMRLDAGDSGLYFRGSLKCQANIWSQELGSGEINGYRTDKSMPQEVRRSCIPIKKADRPFGEWNTFLVTIQGNVMSVKLNNETVLPGATLPDLPESGPIALQHHGDPVQFRKIWIRFPTQ